MRALKLIAEGAWICVLFCVGIVPALVMAALTTGGERDE